MSSNAEDWTLEDFIKTTKLEGTQEVGLKFGAQIGGKTGKIARIKQPVDLNFVAFDRVAKKVKII
jgi:hypothetical protein